MNAGSIVNMVVRLVMRRVIGKGINAGIDAVGNRMSRGKQGDGAGAGTQAPQTGKTQKRVKQSMRAARRLGRF